MRKLLILSSMLLFRNLNAQVTLGNVKLDNVSQVEISENILEMSNTAKITIPKNYKKLNEKPILEQFKVGDKVTISLGYEGELYTEFVGYIKEIDSDIPLVINCEDESYIFRQTNFIKNYNSVTLKKLLADIMPAGIKVECPEVQLGKFQIDNASAFTVLQQVITDYGLYSRLRDGVLRVGLAYDWGTNTQEHTYCLNDQSTAAVYKGNVKQNDLKYKRQEDFKIRYKATATNPNGKKTTVTVGSAESDASERTLNFAGPMSEAQLKETAESMLKKVVYDGYTGDITGFGYPRTHAGDSMCIVDNEYPERGGIFLIEKVEISYNESGYARKNTLSYKI